MKVLKVTIKNLKLLMRSKTSMLVIVLGPLMIMLLVGFAFNNNSVSNLNIGYYSNGTSELSTSFITTLSENPSFLLVNYSSEIQCLDMIQQGKVHLCVIFPENFSIANNKTNELVFYVDQSRINFVYSVIDTVSTKLDVTSTQLSYQMTSDLISVITENKKVHDAQLSRVIRIKDSLNNVSSKLSTVQSRLDKMDFTGTNVDTETMLENSKILQDSIDTLESAASNVIDSGKFLSNMNSTFKGDLDALENLIDGNSTGEDLDVFMESLDEVSSKIDTLNAKLSQIKTATGNSSSDISGNIKALATIKTDLDNLQASIEAANAKINSLKITNAESIVNPIKTTIKPVSSNSGNLNFIFPYFIILIIVFIGIMLSSNLIIMEKTSRAYFRNFTTPTKDLTFVMSIFLTSFIVVVLQLTFILLLAYYFLNAAILSTPWLTILALFGAISLFILLGMFVGYISNNQDSATMIGISVGSVLLFLSNLILPIETMSPFIQNISKYNPYVICSELLKKLTIFESSFNEVYLDLIFIGVYIVIMFTLVMMIEKALKIHFISKKPLVKALSDNKDSKVMKKYFKLKNGTVLTNEKDLVDELMIMTDKEFEQYVNKKNNVFETWFKINKNKILAEKVGKCKTKKELIDVLHENSPINQTSPLDGVKKVDKEDNSKDSKDAVRRK